jgi:hypothetical protein
VAAGGPAPDHVHHRERTRGGGNGKSKLWARLQQRQRCVGAYGAWDKGGGGGCYCTTLFEPSNSMNQTPASGPGTGGSSGTRGKTCRGAGRRSTTTHRGDSQGPLGLGRCPQGLQKPKEKLYTQAQVHWQLCQHGAGDSCNIVSGPRAGGAVVQQCRGWWTPSRFRVDAGTPQARQNISGHRSHRHTLHCSQPGLQHECLEDAGWGWDGMGGVGGARWGHEGGQVADSKKRQREWCTAGPEMGTPTHNCLV